MLPAFSSGLAAFGIFSFFPRRVRLRLLGALAWRRRRNTTEQALLCYPLTKVRWAMPSECLKKRRKTFDRQPLSD